ncbi:MAG TPA: transcriptional repressor [Thermomicrobiales bacterium]|nr:transcriptional repressor [Thermomicrobiales bacterium]
MTAPPPDALTETAAVERPIDAAAIAGLLAAHGYRLTAPRRAVIAAVVDSARPFTAEQAVADIERAAPRIGRATVYRTLEILASLDVLKRVYLADGRAAYVTGAPGHRHHLVCSRCGDVVAFSACPIDQLVRDLSRDTDFAIEGHLLEVFGLCPACRGTAGGRG